MRQKPIQKENIPRRTGERYARAIREEVWRNEDLPVLSLLVGIRSLINTRNHFQSTVGCGGVD
jgi:hypothetical protein